MKILFRRILLVLFFVAVIAAIGYGLMPVPLEVDMAEAQIGSIQVTVDQDGKTRIQERYIVSTPLAGRLLRIELDPGDEIEAGKTLLATVEPRNPELLDARTVAQAEARVKAAEAALERMEPTIDELEAAQEFAEAELQRVRQARLANPASVSESEVQSKLLDYRSRTAMLRSARHNQDIARFELEQARAALLRSRPQEELEAAGIHTENALENGWNFTIRSPIDGRVLRVFQESSGVVAAGTSLLELGDPNDLEVEIDVLSRDAVKVKPGHTVLLEHWGGDRTLHGRVRLVEPSAFTKISTLGVEEQRVNVIVDLLDPLEERQALGDGFRVEARIIVAQASEVLKIPTSALFRVDDDWAAFKVVEGVAQLTRVQVGMNNGLEAEIKEGLAPGDLVVVHPGDNVLDGTLVEQR